MDRERTMRRNRTDWSWTGLRARDFASAWSDWATDVADAIDSFLDTGAPEEERRHRPQRKRYAGRCREKGVDSCQCDCCVYDADLVVYTRLFETRVVPVRISNERNRERTISLDLSDFRTSGGNPAPVAGVIATATEFTLGACEDEQAVIVLYVSPDREEPLTKERLVEAGMVVGTPVEPPDAVKPTTLLEPRQPTDVDDCVVGYADLRIQGCDVRPVRIAVAVLPRTCDAYEVHCGCGCC